MIELLVAVILLLIFSKKSKNNSKLNKPDNDDFKEIIKYDFFNKMNKK